MTCLGLEFFERINYKKPFYYVSVSFVFISVNRRPYCFFMRPTDALNSRLRDNRCWGFDPLNAALGKYRNISLRNDIQMLEEMDFPSQYATFWDCNFTRIQAFSKVMYRLNFYLILLFAHRVFKRKNLLP